MDLIEALLEWDRIAYHIINRAFYNPAAFFFFEVITNIVDVIILSLGVYWLYLLIFDRTLLSKDKIGIILAPVIIAAIITLILKVLIHRGSPTPFITPWLSFDFLPVKYAFPSGHAGRAFALATALVYKFPSKWLWLFSGAALIGFSRIYIGAHYPSDVIAGAILGVSISWLFNKIKKY